MKRLSIALIIILIAALIVPATYVAAQTPTDTPTPTLTPTNTPTQTPTLTPTTVPTQANTYWTVPVYASDWEHNAVDAGLIAIDFDVTNSGTCGTAASTVGYLYSGTSHNAHATDTSWVNPYLIFTRDPSRYFDVGSTGDIPAGGGVAQSVCMAQGVINLPSGSDLLGVEVCGLYSGYNYIPQNYAAQELTEVSIVTINNRPMSGDFSVSAICYGQSNLPTATATPTPVPGDPNTVAYWTLNEQDDDIRPDMTGNGHTMYANSDRRAVFGKLGFASAWDAGQANVEWLDVSNCCTLPGQTMRKYNTYPFLYTPDGDGMPNPTDPLTMSMWVFWEVEYDQVYFTKGDTLDREVEIGYSATIDRFYWRNGDGVVYSDEAPIAGKWHHLIVSRDPTTKTLRMLVNNRSATATTATYTTIQDLPNSVWQLGGTSDALASFAVDEVGLWRKLFNTQEEYTLWFYGYGCSFPFGCFLANDELKDPGMDEITGLAMGGLSFPFGSNWWRQDEWSAVGDAYTAPKEISFDRISPDNLTWWNKIMMELNEGTPKCGNGYQILGRIEYSYGPWNTGSPIAQTFNWSGGNLNWKMSLRTRLRRFVPQDPDSYGHATAYIHPYGSDDPADRIYLFENEAPDSSWTMYMGTLLDVPADIYILHIGMAQDELEYATGALTPPIYEPPSGSLNKTIYVDDVQISKNDVQVECEATLPPGGIPTPATATVGVPIPPTMPPFPGHVTPTPGPSPTQAWSFIFLSNCDFEGATGWQINSGYKGTAGGPVGPQYVAATGTSQSVVRYFTVQDPSILYLQAWVKANAVIKIVNISNGQEKVLYSGYNQNWAHIQNTSTTAVSTGTWRIELNTGSFSAPAMFDGVVLSADGYADPLYSGGCLDEPTPGPTAFLTATKTITPIRGTVTLVPSRTPTPSKTPYGAPWTTSTPWGYGTPGAGTGTPGAGTGTPGAGTGTPVYGTPDGTGTVIPVYGTPDGTPGTGTPIAPGASTPTPITPGGDQPPPDWEDPDGDGISCDRPTNPWSVSWWIDYEMCRFFSFVAFGPTQRATAEAMPAILGTYEPFRSMSAVEEGVNAASTRVAQYDWQNQGDPEGDPMSPAYVNSGNGINPHQPLNTWNDSRAIDPWTEGGQIIFVREGDGGWQDFSVYCYNNFAESLGGQNNRLTQGTCFVLGVFRVIGLTPWIQWFLNIASILGLIKAIQVTIGMYATTQAAMADDKASKSDQGRGKA